MIALLVAVSWGGNFEGLDADGNGSLVAAELAKGMGPDGTEEKGRSLLDLFDVDRSGTWSRNEFDAWASSLQRGPLSIPVEAFAQSPPTQQISMEGFQEMDADHGGTLTAGEVPDPRMLAALDVDHDGSLSFAEFHVTTIGSLDGKGTRASLGGMAGIADQGGDGRWSKDELARLGRLMPRDLSEPVADMLRFDANGDAHLDAGELDAWLAHRARVVMFAWCDTSKDGRVDAPELLVGLGLISPAAAAGAVRQSDRNGDGGLDAGEFEAARAAVVP